MTEQTKITIETKVQSSVEDAWKIWTLPEFILQWNHASDEWFCPKAENDLRVGGKFNFRMEARDGSFGFDFEGIYDEIKINERIIYSLGDGRKVIITFTSIGSETKVTESFDAENINSIELQKTGWQSILNNYKKCVESKILI